MKMWMKVAIVTLVVAVPAMMLGRVIWPPAEGGPIPTGGQMPFFIFLAAAEALVFGLGVSFLLFGLPAMRRLATGSASRAWAMYLAVGWLLVSWWPHDNMHIHNGENLQGLLYIEFGYHVTLMLGGLVLAWCFLSLAQENASKAAAG